MKKILLGCCALTIAFAACKKDNDEQPPVVDPERPAKAISVDSAQTLSDSVRVIHNQAYTKGNIPAAAGSNAKMLLVDNKDTVLTTNGGYVLITPVFTQDALPVSGYYVQVDGANGYYTTAFTAPMNNTRKAANPHQALKTGATPADSLLMFRLPLHMTGGYFKVKYAAYDAAKNITNTITTTVAVMANDSTSADFKLLAGKWTGDSSYVLTAEGKREDVDVDNFAGDSASNHYMCMDNGQLTPTEDVTQPLYLEWWSRQYADDLVLSNNNHFNYTWDYRERQLDLANSTCGHPQYSDLNDQETGNGTFVYVPSQHLLALIYDRDGVSGDNDVLMADILELTDKRLVWKDHNDPTTHIQTLKR